MESGSFAGAPAEAEQPQTQPEPPVTPEQVASETEAPPAEQGEENKVLSALDEMREKFDAFTQQQAAEPSPATGLLDALNEGEEPELDYEEPVSPEPEYQDPAAQQQIDQLRAFVRDEAQQLVNPIQQERRDDQLGALEQRYPDITSKAVMSRLKPEMEALVQRSGNAAIKDDPRVVEVVYKAVKAEMADAAGVPAESAAQQGASLETNSGVGNAQAGEPSIEDYYKQNVYKRVGSDL